MAEDWEDWENEDFTPQLPAVPAQPATAEDDIAAAKFAGEDEEEEEEKQYNVPKPQQVQSHLWQQQSTLHQSWCQPLSRLSVLCRPSQGKKRLTKTKTQQ